MPAISAPIATVPGHEPRPWRRCAVLIGLLCAAMSLHAAEGESIAEILEEEDPDLTQIQAQIDAGEYDITKAWLELRIREIEESTHRFDPALIRPITLRGDIKAREGDYTGALDDYGQAVHLERVNGGLVSPAQVEIVYREAEVYRALGDLKTANEREEYAYHVLRRAHDTYDPELLPGLYHLAEWYRSTNNVYAARALYQHALAILSSQGKNTTPEAITALSGLAATYRIERFPPYYVTAAEDVSYGTSVPATASLDSPIVINNFPAGEAALQSIVQIRREHEEDPIKVAESILELADWYLLFEKSRRAFPLYEHVYQVMNATEDFPADAFFAQPVLLYFPQPSDPKAMIDGGNEAVEGHVELVFDLSEEGEVRNLRTLSSEPEGMMDFRVRKSMRLARYRPALVNGVPVPTSDHTYRHAFTYYPQAEAVADNSAGEATP